MKHARWPAYAGIVPPRRPLLIGHRGAPGYRPEHTRSSYALAFEMGVDAVEPDVVFSRDGVAVIRHENEIGSSTDVAAHPEFADRRTTKVIDGQELAGWFTEDFTWEELATLRCRERLPALRSGSASFDDSQPILRLSDLLALIRQASLDQGREIGLVLEVKHAAYFDALGYAVADLLAAELDAARWTHNGMPLWIEAFEWSILQQLQERGVAASFVFLCEAEGRPADLEATMGEAAPTFAELAAGGTDALPGRIDGISVNKSMLLAGPPHGGDGLVTAAHARGLTVFTWTLRPENAFLQPAYREGADNAQRGDYGAEWAAILATGVDGVFVDHPDLFADVFR